MLNTAGDGQWPRDDADRRAAGLSHRVRQVGARHLAQCRGQSRLCRGALSPARDAQRHAHRALRDHRAQGDIEPPDRHRLPADDGHGPGGPVGARVLPLGAGEETRPRQRCTEDHRARPRRKRSGSHARGTERTRPAEARPGDQRLAVHLRGLRHRRADRPCRRHGHHGQRAPARHPPLPEHGTRAFRRLCRALRDGSAR